MLSAELIQVAQITFTNLSCTDTFILSVVVSALTPSGNEIDANLLELATMNFLSLAHGPGKRMNGASTETDGESTKDLGAAAVACIVNDFFHLWVKALEMTDEAGFIDRLDDPGPALTSRITIEEARVVASN
jgi:hypothetical protein